MRIPQTHTLKNATRELRINTSLNIMKLLSPSTYNWINQAIIGVHNTPRPFTKMLKAQDKPFMQGCEIGYGEGINAKNLLKELPIKRLYCIDPYIAEPYNQGEMEISSYASKTTRNNFLTMLGDPRVTFIQKPSDAAATDLQHIKFDFIYIDGNHTYEYVKQDLALYTELLRPNGFIGGHDYIYGQNGVIQAVQEHAIDLGIPPTIQFPDYWFQLQKKENHYETLYSWG